MHNCIRSKNIEELEFVRFDTTAAYKDILAYDFQHDDEFSGVSVMSHNGDHLAGFEQWKGSFGKDEQGHYADLRGIDFPHPLYFDKPTIFYRNSPCDFLKKMGLIISRARYTRLKPGGGLKPHTDALPSVKNKFRIHIPIHTNPDSYFEIDDKKWHMHTGRIYIVDVAAKHSVKNNGFLDRWHFICDAWDPTGVFEISKISQEELNSFYKQADFWQDYITGKHNDYKCR